MVRAVVLGLVFRPDDVIGQIDQRPPNGVNQTRGSIFTQQNVDGFGMFNTLGM